MNDIKQHIADRKRVMDKSKMSVDERRPLFIPYSKSQDPKYAPRRPPELLCEFIGETLSFSPKYAHEQRERVEKAYKAIKGSGKVVPNAVPMEENMKNQLIGSESGEYFRSASVPESNTRCYERMKIEAGEYITTVTFNAARTNPGLMHTILKMFSSIDEGIKLNLESNGNRIISFEEAA